MQKIYFNNKSLIVSENITPAIKNYLGLSNTVFMDELSDQAVNTIVSAMQQPEVNTGVFIYNDMQKVISAIKEKFVVIQAAGGLVHTSAESILLIFRKGKWDLPKGKLDDGEELESCATREVEEETGIENIKSEKFIMTTYHTYAEKGAHILKETFWYLMYSKEEQILKPQVEENIEKCEWVPVIKLLPFLQNAHLSVIDVIHQALKMLKKE